MAKSITKLKTHSALPIRNVGEVIHLRLEQIHPSETNPRLYFDEDGMAELANSIKTHGVLQPLLVRPMLGENSMSDYYALVSGERRWRAAKLAGLETAPCYVRQLSETEALEAQIVENLQRLDVTPFEEARGLKVLRDGGQSAAAIAARIGKSPRYVWQSFGLLNLMENETAMKDLAAGTLNRSVALEIASLPSVALVNKAVKELRDWQGNYPPVVKVRERIDAEFRRELKGAPFNQTDKYLVPEAGSCKVCPKRTGNNRELYPTGRADICTDTSCFDAKIKAMRANELSEMEKLGHEIITGTKADEIVGYGGAVAFKSRETYVSADEQCDTDKKKRTWRELMGKTLPIIVENKNGHRLAVFRVADAVAAAQAKKIPLHPQLTPETSPAQKTQMAEQKKLRELMVAKALEKVGNTAASQTWSDVIRQSLPEFISACNAEELVSGHLTEETDENAELAPYIENLKATDLLRLIGQIVVFDHLDSWQRWGNLESYPKVELDWDALKAQAEAELYPANEEAA